MSALAPKPAELKKPQATNGCELFKTCPYCNGGKRGWRQLHEEALCSKCEKENACNEYD